MKRGDGWRAPSGVSVLSAAELIVRLENGGDGKLSIRFTTIFIKEKKNPKSSSAG